MNKAMGNLGMPNPSEIEFDDLPVRVLFEVGRRDISLGDLRRLYVGALFPLARKADNAVDIMVSGRRIGRGAIVKIGETVGVRVSHLFDHG